MDPSIKDFESAIAELETIVKTLEEGDLVAIFDVGAYGMVLASNYNTRPRPAEVLVSGKSAKLIRRLEKISDLLRSET